MASETVSIKAAHRSIKTTVLYCYAGGVTSTCTFMELKQGIGEGMVVINSFLTHFSRIFK